jgi:membrane protease YdiL (CAAX protease family)
MLGIRFDLVAFSIVFALLLAAVGGMFWSWAWGLGRLRRGLPLVSDEGLGTLPTRPAPWGLLTVVAIVILYLGVNLTVHQLYLASAGQVLSPTVASKPKNDGAGDASKSVETTTAGKEPEDQGPKEAATDAPQASTDQMLQLAVVNLLLIVLVPAQLRLSSGATLADLGLHVKRWRRQMAVGAQYALLMTPVVYAVQFVAVMIWSRQKHPVEQMILNKFTVSGAILAILSTTVLAPLVEELLFRCIIQRWLCRLLGGSGKREPQALRVDDFEPTSDNLAVVQPLDPASSLPQWNPYAPPVAQQLAPTFPLPGKSTDLPGQPHSSHLAIFFTSLAFAAMHAPQWPAPIAIFLLAMALGTVYQRTGSLIAAVTMHGTFNGISTVLLLLAAISLRIRPQLHQPPQGFADSITNVLEFLRYVLSLAG